MAELKEVKESLHGGNTDRGLLATNGNELLGEGRHDCSVQSVACVRMAEGGRRKEPFRRGQVVQQAGFCGAYVGGCPGAPDYICKALKMKVNP